jgi:DNA polymerase III alpha subunit (gram-positive type)
MSILNLFDEVCYMNFLWVDVETTGMYSDKNDVVQLACIPVVNGVPQQFFNEFCQPKNWNAIEEGAIRVHGITRDRMKTFQTQEQLLDKLIPYLKSFDTKFIIAGYNVDFDKRFMGDMFSKCGRPEDFFSLFELHTHDVYKRVKTVKTQIKTENHKLETLAKHYGIEIKAHDAYSDIAATIEVDKHVGKLLGEEERAPKTQIVEINVDNYNLPEPAQLHLHSMYGMVESVPSVKDWAKWCKENDIKGFSVVDHGPAISIIDAVKVSDESVTAVPGVGLYFMIDNKLHPFNAWAVNETGYLNIMKLSSLGYETQIEDDGVIRPVVTHEHIEQHKEGVVFGTGDMYGAIGSNIRDDNDIGAEESFKEYVQLFGDKLYVEFLPVSITESYSSKTGFQAIKKNHMIPDGDLGKAYNNFLMDMVEKYKLKAIPSSGAHFIEQKDKLLQDVIAKNSYDSGKYYIESYHVRSGKDMYKVLKRQLGDRLTLDQFGAWIYNTLDIVEQAQGIKPP